ncbi:hypothetical protein CU955_23410, partial [Salmonella enterica]|nr:hypothetical protein [Salmonella enterica]
MKKIILGFLCCIIFLIVKPVFASCTLSIGTSTAPMPLQIGNFSAGADVPVGTKLYSQTYNLDISTSRQDAVTCTTGGQININYYFSSTPLPLNAWNQDIQAGKVYETGVPGIGVWVHQGTNGSIAIPGVKTPGNGSSCSSPNNCVIDIRHKRWDVEFIKTGPISPGVISGASLPCVGISYNNTGVNSDGQIENVCMTGSINVVVNTCTTPDV